jgi:hypothetical protein
VPAPSKQILAERAEQLQLERDRLLGALGAAAHPDGRSCPGNQRRAAEALGYSLATLKRRLGAAGLTAEELRERWPLGERQPWKKSGEEGEEKSAEG